MAEHGNWPFGQPLLLLCRSLREHHPLISASPTNHTKQSTLGTAIQTLLLSMQRAKTLKFSIPEKVKYKLSKLIYFP